jgi:hypothetical protein
MKTHKAQLFAKSSGAEGAVGDQSGATPRAPCLDIIIRPEGADGPCAVSVRTKIDRFMSPRALPWAG